MEYPGNSKIEQEIRERILKTFGQTLELAGGGRRQEAVLGCDFILRLDPEYRPARVLLDRLQSGDGPVEVGDLAPDANPPIAVGEPLDDDDLSYLDEDDGDLAHLAVADDGDDSAAALLAEDRALEAAFRDLLKRRELRRLVQVAEERKDEVAADPALRKLVETAYTRLEAEPYLENFLEGARKAFEAGDPNEGRTLLHKAQSLDPSHPKLAAVEELEKLYEQPDAHRTAAGAPAAAAPQTSAPPPPEPPPAAAGAGPEVAGDDSDFDTGVSLFGDGADAAPIDGEDRIPELLAEGQAAFDRGDHQTAIDTWSRIFLIDIDNEEAARRIEEARRLKAEGDRQVEEVYHDALTAMEVGDVDAARRGFQRVLDQQPNYQAAREQLEQLDLDATLPPSSAPAGAQAPLVPPPPPDDEAAEPLEQDILVPPDPDAAPPPPPAGIGGANLRGAAAASPVSSPRRRFVIIGGAVLVLLLALGWLGVRQWDSLFPNSTEESAGSGEDLMARAVRLHDEGKTGAAIRALDRVQQSDPRYEEARELLARFEAELEVPGTASPEEESQEPAGPSMAQLAHRSAFLEEARQAFAAGEYRRADSRFRQAAAIQPLSGAEERLYQQAQEELEPLRQQIDLFEQGDWEFVLPMLWRLHQEQPENRDVVNLIVDSYYNLGVRRLQRSDAAGAVEMFEEARQLAESDPILERHLLLARSYENRSKDLLYQIYVKYIPFR